MKSRRPSGPLIQALFRLTLAALGLGLRLACAMSASFRSQLAHPRTVLIGSAEGVHRHYVFSRRAVRSVAGTIERPDVGLCFDNAALGLVVLTSTDAVGRIVRALLDEKAIYEGNAVLVLWFFALTRYVLPFGRTGALRSPPPDAFLAPDPNSKVASRTVIEPVADELDPAWEAAHDRRAQMVMPRGSAGEDVRLW